MLPSIAREKRFEWRKTSYGVMEAWTEGDLGDDWL
jgi:hypothetical protein